MRDNFKGRLLMAVVLLAMVAGFYWKLTLTRQFDWIWGPDLATQVLPWFQEQARFWSKGIVPLWDPTLWAGQPFLGQNQPGTAYPLNWILFSIPLRAGGYIRSDVLQWYFVAMHFLAVVFCYWLCRDLGRSRTASLAGGAIFGLGGYIGGTSWPQMINGAEWAPLVFLFLLRAVQRRNTFGNAALSGMFLGIAWLSGHHQAPMFIAVAAAGAWLFYILRSGKVDWRLARAASVAMLFMILTGALQILPAYEYGHQAVRWVDAPDPIHWNQPVPYYAHELHELKAVDLIGTVFPYFHANSDPFVGVAALALAFIGLAMCWREPGVRLLAAVGAAGLVYALGHLSVFQGLLYGLLPELDKARNTSAAVFLLHLGIAVLAACGLDQLGSAAASAWLRRVMWAVLAFAVVNLCIFEAVLFNHRFLQSQDSTMLVPFFALGVAGLLCASFRGALSRKQAGVLMVLLILFELGNNTGSVISSRFDPSRSKWLDQIHDNADVAAYLKNQPGFFRTTVANDAFPENWGEYYGLDMWQGYLASLTDNMRRFEFWRYPARMLFGVAYTLSGKPVEDGGEAVFTGKSGLTVYRYSAVFPRAWAVHRLEQAHSADDGNRIINERLADLHDVAFLLGPPPALENCGAQDETKLVEHLPNRVRIDARMGCKGMLILSDTFYPGWHASIDGNAAPIYEVNEAMRGVVVPGGAHMVTLEYRPLSAMAGLMLTLAGILGALAWWRLGLRSSNVRSFPLETSEKPAAI